MLGLETEFYREIISTWIPDRKGSEAGFDPVSAAAIPPLRGRALTVSDIRNPDQFFADTKANLF